MSVFPKVFSDFFKLAGPFWNSANKTVIRLETATFVVLTVLQMVLAVVITEWNAALFDAIEIHSVTEILTLVGILVLIFVASVSITTSHLLVKRRILIGWRIWLTEKVVSRWMYKGQHYQITLMAKNNHDNPDGRIAEDIRIVTEEAIAIGHGLFYSLLLLVGFTKLLWTLSGNGEVDFGIFSFAIPGYLVWLAIVYSALASILGWWMGRPMTEATNFRQTEEAEYRYDLIKVQDNSQAIALIRGEAKEQERLFGSFQGIVDSYGKQTVAWKQIQIFTSGYSVMSMALPVLVAVPRYISNAITLGTLMQSAQAFQQMVSALSWPANNMAQIAKWRTSVERVLGLVKALDDLEYEISCLNSHQICVNKVDGASLKLVNLSIASMENEPLTAIINAEIKPGEWVLLSGPAENGAKLFQAIAGLWPWGSGHIEAPEHEELFFMPPKPYLPTGGLLEAICYPRTISEITRPEVERIMRRVGLSDLVKQLDRSGSWEKLLSSEHQQLLGLVRVLLNNPKWLFIQEALDSLTPEGETKMFGLLKKELPDTAVLSITNQPTANAFHQRKLKI